MTRARQLGWAMLPLLLLLVDTHHVAANPAQLTLTWIIDYSTYADGFSLERATGTGGAFAEVARVGAGISSYIDSNLTAGTIYCYQVRAFNSIGYSAYSNQACGTAYQTFALVAVRAGTGSGTVTSAPTGSSCGSACSGVYPSGTAVTLTATAASDSSFSGWSGGGCSGTGTCTVTLAATTTVSATFTVNGPLTLTSLTPDSTAPQPPGTTITWTATATGGSTPYSYKWWVFDGTTWTVVQNWTANNTYAWTPTVANPNAQVGVWVRSAGITADIFDRQQSTGNIPFAVRPHLTLSRLTRDKTAPQLPGTTIIWTATATGGTTPYSYKWWVFDGVTWAVTQNWSTSPTYAWTPTVANRNYQVGVG